MDSTFYKVLDLFSGIGGFSLGLERTGGFKTMAFCEIEKYPRQILHKHWPNVPIFKDVRNLTIDRLGNLLYIGIDGSISVQHIKGNNMPAKKDPKYDNCVDLYNAGLSIQDCAEFYAITRQAMHKILKRRGCKFRPQKRYGGDNHFNRNGYTTGQRRAGHLVEKAIKKGIIQRKTHCENCGSINTFSDGRAGVQAHHNDYNKPLEVIWLCQKCHYEWHKKNTAKEIKEVPAKQAIDVVCGGYP